MERANCASLQAPASFHPGSYCTDPVIAGFCSGLHISFFTTESKSARTTMHSGLAFFITHLDHHLTFLQSQPSWLGRGCKAKASWKRWSQRCKEPQAVSSPAVLPGLQLSVLCPARPCIQQAYEFQARQSSLNTKEQGTPLHHNQSLVSSMLGSIKSPDLNRTSRTRHHQLMQVGRKANTLLTD